MPKLTPWSSVPRDPNLTNDTYQFLTWVQQAVVDLQATTQRLGAPVMSVRLINGVAQLTWTAVPGAVSYALYETPLSGVASVPFITLAANQNQGANSYTRSRPGIGVFYYAVRAIASDGSQGDLSDFHAVSQLPPNISAAPLAPAILFNFNMSADVVFPGAIVLTNLQPVIFSFGQQGAGGFVFTWPTNTVTHGTVSGTAGATSIQNFIYSAASNNNPDGLLYPTSAMIFT